MLGLAAVLASGLLTGSAAASQVFVLDTLVTGSPSANQGGVGSKAIFAITATNAGTNQVRLDFTTNLGPQEFISQTYLNLNPALSASHFSASHLGGATANTVAFTTNGESFSGTGANFDVLFGFATSNGSRLGNSSGSRTNFRTSSYLVTYTGSGTFTEDSFHFRSSPSRNSPQAQYYIGAHVQGIQPGERSGRYVQAVPEPGSIVLLGALMSGLVGCVGVGRLVRRRATA
jgi:hypothetical protein